MAIAKPTLPTGVSFSLADLMDGMDGGKVYIADGAYADKAAVLTAFADQTAAATELSTNFEEFGEFQEKPFTFKSDVAVLKAYKVFKQGRRTTSAEYNLIGLDDKQKDWLESDLNKEVRTIVVVSEDKSKIVVVNNCKWVMNWSGEADDWFKVIIKTEFSGLTEDKIIPVVCPEA